MAHVLEAAAPLRGRARAFLAENARVMPVGTGPTTTVAGRP
ncbi:hypothetical protein [Salinispora pacifica]|nr:hypothetical protein [Salinispora pacifica]